MLSNPETPDAAYDRGRVVLVYGSVSKFSSSYMQLCKQLSFATKPRSPQSQLKKKKFSTRQHPGLSYRSLPL